MFSLEKKIKELKVLFEIGKIDEIQYNEELDKLIRRNEIIKKNKKVFFLNLLKICKKLIVFIIIFIITIWFYKSNNIGNTINEKLYSEVNGNVVEKVIKETEHMKNLNNIPEPIQIETTGSTIKKVNDLNVEISYVAQYSISGRVVDVQDYSGNDVEEQLSPKDVGISWGFLANESNHKKITWSSYGNRFLYWQCSDRAWIRQIGGVDKITEYYSNNHIIPSDEKTEKLIAKVRKNDFIKIEGYLVNIYCKENNRRYFYWNTSTSRKDEGNGACELIYVTNVTWLKEE